MVPINTSVDDMEKLLSYMNKQIGWVELTKLKKTLGNSATDDRKIGTMVALGLVERDGANLKLATRGQRFATGDKIGALRDAISNYDLYRSTVEWIHYGKKIEVTAAEIGQYWESSHKDTLGNLKGRTIKDGAVNFSRVADGADLGSFKVGRGGKETRLTSNLNNVELFLYEDSSATLSPEEGVEPSENNLTRDTTTPPAPVSKSLAPIASTTTQQLPRVEVSTSPSVHVNVEIHIAADATADTVKEIFKNMARYVLDKPMSDDGDK